MKRYITLILFCFLSFNLFGQSLLKKFNDDNRTYKYQDIVEVSIIQLISNPEKYDGKIICVFGYVKLEFEGTAVYFHQEDYKRHLYKNSVWLHLSRENSMNLADECSDKYCQIIGTFNANLNGHGGMFSGTIYLQGLFPRE